MPHETTLIATIAVAFVGALLLGLLAARLRLPPIVGYLLAGIAMNALAPALGADRRRGGAGVGARRGPADVRRRTALLAARPDGGAEDRRARRAAPDRGDGNGRHDARTRVGTLGRRGADAGPLARRGEHGRRAEGARGARSARFAGGAARRGMARRRGPRDGRSCSCCCRPWRRRSAAPRRAMRSHGRRMALSLALAIWKVVAFLVLMFVGGRRVVPWLLEHVARLGSRELFTLTVLAIALGVGTIASQLFGMSFALGAFVAGAVVSESELSHRAAADALPLQDAFAVLFFVSVGLLFDHRVLVDHPGAGARGARRDRDREARRVLPRAPAARRSRHARRSRSRAVSPRSASSRSSSSRSASRSGCSSARRRRSSSRARCVSITVNQPLGAWLARAFGRLDRAPIAPTLEPPVAIETDFGGLTGHVVLVGYGRVGTTVTEALDRAGVIHIVVEEQPRVVAGLRLRGEHAVSGDATRPEVLERAGVAGARLIVVTAPEPIRARRIVEVAQRAESRHRGRGAHAQRERAGVLRVDAAHAGRASGARCTRSGRWR